MKDSDIDDGGWGAWIGMVILFIVCPPLGLICAVLMLMGGSKTE